MERLEDQRCLRHRVSELSEKVRREKPDLIIPTRWVRTNKHDGLVGKEVLAKSRLVVQGFKDKSLGRFRRDAPTASAVAESICLAVCAFFKFTLFAKDIKNAYFSGKSVDREIYLEQPRGGLPGLLPRQLLRAKKAIYGFAEAARLFWLALREHLLSDGWVESKLEPALFYLRQQGRLVGILVTHVDDLEGGVNEKVINSAFERSARALEFATNHYKDFIFRGREVRQNEQNHIDVSMKNYALSMKTVKVDSGRRKELRSELTPEELSVFQSSAGELGWIARQLRCDLAASVRERRGSEEQDGHLRGRLATAQTIHRPCPKRGRFPTALLVGCEFGKWRNPAPRGFRPRQWHS